MADVVSDEFPLGLVYGLPIEKYHSMPGISSTGLKTLARSPEHFYARHRDPKRPPAADKGGHLEGQLAHCAILEPSEFAKRYVTLPAGAPARPTKAQWNAKDPSASSIKAMDWWLDFNERTKGATPITGDQYDAAMRQAESVRRLTPVRELLDNCSTEVSEFWIDPDTGVQCRCRPDLIHAPGDGAVLADVKTYADASPGGFAREVAKKLYHLQDAYYSEGHQRATGQTVHGFVFIAVEDEWPFAACAHMLDDDSREIARALMRQLLDTYAECTRTGVWPGYSDAIELISLPRWRRLSS
jgi:hypothetical protein